MMNKNQFRLMLDATHNNLVSMTATKGEEYSRDNDDQLANFKRQAADLGVSSIMVLAVYLNKHLDAIKSFIKNGREFSEPIGGRIDDSILYLILLKGLISDHRSESNLPTGPRPMIYARTMADLCQDPAHARVQKVDTHPQFELK